jgi:transcriptional regulator with XRE-family HTH domain
MPAKLTRRDDLGLALTFLRRIRGWEQAELAAAAGVHPQSVRALERSHRPPSFRTLGPVTSALSVDLGVLSEVVALIRRLRQGRGSGARPAGAAFAPAPALRREITRLVVAGCERAADAPAPGGHEMPQGTPVSLGSGQALGLAVAFLRWIKGQTHEELAASSGVPLNSVEDLEDGLRKRSSPGTLGRLESALGVEPGTLTELAGLFSRLREGMAAAADGEEGVETRAGEAFGTAPALRRELTALIQAACAGEVSGQPAPDRAAARQRAAALWRALAPGGELRLGMVQQIPEVQTVEFCELLCEESLRAAADSAERARRLADLAVAVAERVGGPEGWRSRLAGYAGVHLASAMRVEGTDLPAAGEAFERANERWEAGAEDDPGLLNAARVMGLEASLRRAQRRLPEALALLDRALAIDLWGETPLLLLAKARALFELGDYEASIRVLQATLGQIDAEREPRQRWVALSLLLHDLCLLGRAAAAAERLGELRALGRKLGNRLDLLRLSWLEGKIAAATGRPEEAITTLEQVREKFVALKNSYDVALVTVELAEVLAGLGRHAEVRTLAEESVPIFRDQGVHVEAQRALALFCRAAEKERATTELLRALLAYLYRARFNPGLRFEAAA